MASHHTPDLTPKQVADVLANPPRQLGKRTADWAISQTAYRVPASADDEIARLAAAEIEREEGYDRTAQHRIHGAYDGDESHRIALKAIQLLRERMA